MSGRTTVLLCLLAGLCWTTVVNCQGSSENLGTIIDEVFGTPPTDRPGDGGTQVVNNNNNNNNNNEGPRTNEELTTNPGSGIGGDKCQCVPYYLCANNTIITDGTGLLDFRIKSECDNYMDVCCGEPLEPERAIKPKPHGRLGCGKRNIDGVGFRITGNVDNEAQFGEFPWMVAILKEDILEDGSKLNIYQCGGSLIHEQVVLTAAHCIIGKGVETLKVRAGEWDTQTTNELYPHQDRQVAQAFTHEKYYSGALHNDVALLILRDPIEFADNVDITCLPLQGDVIINNECYASGWGKDVFELQKKDEMPPPGSDGDLGVRFLSNRRDIPPRNSNQFQSQQGPSVVQNFQNSRQHRHWNFGQGMFQGSGGQQPFSQQPQPNIFTQGIHQQRQQQPNIIQGFLQGLQNQQQQPNIIQGFLQGLQNQRPQHQGFVQNVREGFEEHRQQNQQQQNFAEGIIQGFKGLLQKKTEFIKSKTEEFVNQFSHNRNNNSTTDNPFITKETEHTTFAPPTSLPTATPTVPGKEGHYQVILKRVDLPMVPRNKCEAELRKTRLGPYFRLHESFVCAGGVNGKDTCKGDGGGPLVCPIPGRDYQYQQVGIVAWGIGCGNETPAVYVNVAQFRDWIDNHMRKLNFKFEYNY